MKRYTVALVLISAGLIGLSYVAVLQGGSAEWNIGGQKVLIKGREK